MIIGVASGALGCFHTIKATMALRAIIVQKRMSLRQRARIDRALPSSGASNDEIAKCQEKCRQSKGDPQR